MIGTVMYIFYTLVQSSSKNGSAEIIIIIISIIIVHSCCGGRNVTMGTRLERPSTGTNVSLVVRPLVLVEAAAAEYGAA